MNDRKEVLAKEIGLIQACISRMAQNSFIIKGWTISLVAVVLALLPTKSDVRLLCIVSIIAIACFWYLDAFFLKMEHLYRRKYEWVIANRLQSDEYCYDLNPHNNKMWEHDQNGNSREAQSILQVMFSRTLMPIYIPLLILSITLFIIK